MGYVGIPVAARFAAAGFRVIGLDRDATRVATLRAAGLPLAHSEPGLVDLVRAGVGTGKLAFSTDPGDLSGTDVFIMAVDTPIDDRRRPDTSNLAAACDTASRYALPNSLVVVESTLAPGTMRSLVSAAFQRTSTLALAHCPERVRPGRLLANLRGMERLIGVNDAEVGALCVELYSTIVKAPLSTATWETAEVVKTAENTARDVQIAIANQLAVVCDHVGADIALVRDHVNRLWSSEPLILEPGPGVGGYCLPKDPWLLISSLPPSASSGLVRGARETNDAMPDHVVAIARRALERAAIRPIEARIAVLGLTYNADSEDVRNAPGPRIARILEQECGEVVQHDPFVAPGRGTLATLQGVDLAILVVAHTEYRELDLERVKRVVRHACLVDCRHVVDRAIAETVGFTYYGVGAASLA